MLCVGCNRNISSWTSTEALETSTQTDEDLFDDIVRGLEAWNTNVDVEPIDTD
jgi:hypothetical protein